MNPLIQLKKPTPLIVTVLSLACFALAQAVVPPPDGAYSGGNTAEGNFALLNLTTGRFNTAVGLFSLAANTDGDANTGVGARALRNNTEGFYNTAVGVDALNRNRVGGDNTAVGAQALFANTIGDSNTAVGAEALRYNTTGTHNTAVGVNALPNNNAESNTGVGNGVLFNNIYQPPHHTLDTITKDELLALIGQMKKEIMQGNVAQYELIVSYLKIFLITAASLVVAIPLGILLSPVLMGQLTGGIGLIKFPFTINYPATLITIPLTLVFITVCSWVLSGNSAFINPRTLINT